MNHVGPPLGILVWPSLSYYSYMELLLGFQYLLWGGPTVSQPLVETAILQLCFIYSVWTTFRRLTWQSYGGRTMQVIISAKVLPISLSLVNVLPLTGLLQSGGFLCSSGPRWLLAPWAEEVLR